MFQSLSQQFLTLLKQLLTQILESNLFVQIFLSCLTSEVHLIPGIPIFSSKFSTLLLAYPIPLLIGFVLIFLTAFNLPTAVKLNLNLLLFVLAFLRVQCSDHLLTASWLANLTSCSLFSLLCRQQPNLYQLLSNFLDTVDINSLLKITHNKIKVLLVAFPSVVTRC